MTGRPLASALAVSGLASLVAAAVAGELAWLHMRWTVAAYGAICGGAGLHCPGCPTALALLALGLGLLALAARPRLAPVRPDGR